MLAREHVTRRYLKAPQMCNLEFCLVFEVVCLEVIGAPVMLLASFKATVWGSVNNTTTHVMHSNSPR
jgi:hypothetical protein